MATIERHRKPWIPKPVTNGQNWSNTDKYNNTAWRKYSAGYIKTHPLCEECKRNGRIVTSRVVDHIVPISTGGDFWDYSNHQALCISCHNRKSVIERRGR